EDYEFNGGKADLVGWKDGAADALILSTDSQPSPISGIGEKWYPSTDDIGTWNVRGMLWESGLIDIGRYFPYPAGAGGQQIPVEQTWKLNVLLEGQAGEVSSAPEGIACSWSTYPQNCTAEYENGTEVALNAADVDGYTFTGWASDACAEAEGNTCTVTMSSDLFVSAQYEPLPNYQVAVAKRLTDGGVTGGGRVTSSEPGIDCGADCAEQFVEGTQLSLTASDTAGATFERWSNDSPVCAGSTSAVCTFTVVDNTTAVAVFREGVAITAQRASTNTGLDIPGGFISSSPAGISCGETCSAGFQSGEQVTVTASAAQGWSFEKWTSPSECADPPENTSSSCTFVVTGSTTVRAEFAPDPVTLSGFSLGAPFDVGEVCPGFDDSAAMMVTLSYSGTMEEGATIAFATDVDNDNTGVFDPGPPGNYQVFSGVTAQTGSVIFQSGYCWGTPNTVLRYRLKYVDPVGGESNEVQSIVPRP
ncbi:MAG: InlB B-repeat-containing protein, partial [Wenzhouxiangella sp.]|nr:InlB B-repeat-containing protein [Wenzhouxiangella sp.]